MRDRFLAPGFALSDSTDPLDDYERCSGCGVSEACETFRGGADLDKQVCGECWLSDMHRANLTGDCRNADFDDLEAFTTWALGRFGAQWFGGER